MRKTIGDGAGTRAFRAVDGEFLIDRFHIDGRPGRTTCIGRNEPAALIETQCGIAVTAIIEDADRRDPAIIEHFQAEPTAKAGHLVTGRIRTWKPVK